MLPFIILLGEGFFLFKFCMWDFYLSLLFNLTFLFMT